MAKIVESLEHWGPLQLMVWGVKEPPSPARLFEHPDRPDPEKEAKEITTDRAQIRRFFARMEGG